MKLGVVILNGWAGITRHRVEILRETPSRYQVRALERMPLAGRNRWLNAGDEALVPKRAVRVQEGER